MQAPASLVGIWGVGWQTSHSLQGSQDAADPELWGTGGNLFCLELQFLVCPGCTRVCGVPPADTHPNSLYPQDPRAAPMGRTPGKGESVPGTALAIEEVGVCFLILRASNREANMSTRGVGGLRAISYLGIQDASGPMNERGLPSFQRLRKPAKAGGRWEC